jgi:hypothetical protein
MCPNETCERFNQPTGLMGGCDCGTALVPYKSLDDQVRDALWDVTPPAMKRMVTYGLLARLHDESQRRES